MSKFNFSFKQQLRNVVLGSALLASVFSCSEKSFDTQEIVFKKANVVITNPGFESSWTGWTEIDPAAISGVSNSGSKALKITGSGGKATQVVAVSANTDYTFSAYVDGKGVVGVTVNGTDYKTTTDNAAYALSSVSFNSGSATSVTLFLGYSSGESRFDDVMLESGSVVDPGPETGTITKLSVASASSSADDGNVAANTLDGSLSTRWSANGSGEYITFDLGSSKSVSSLKAAWFKGDQRSSNFTVSIGATTSSLTQVYAGSSAGNTTALEDVSFTTTSGRYVRITGLGNSANTWNSLTEVEIYGVQGTTEEDTTPPAAVSNLEATAGNGSVTLSWTNPTDSDFREVFISYVGGSAFSSGTSTVISGLTNGTTYTFSVSAYDNWGNGSTVKTVSAQPIGTVIGGTYPSDIIPSIVDWKLTLPVDKDGNDNSNISDGTKRITTPLEIKDNDLIGYEYGPYFEVLDNEVVFRGHCAGVTTSGSWYPRCELRQRVGGGDNYWSVNKNQYLETTMRVTHLPDNKPEVSIVQIHGPENEPLRVQFHETTGLYLVWNESNKEYFKSDVPYTLGQQLNIKVTVSGGDITCVVKNVDTGKSYSKTWTSNDSTGYFKVGCYTQSTIYLNQYKGGSYVNEPLTAYGEVTVSAITLVETY